MDQTFKIGLLFSKTSKFKSCISETFNYKFTLFLRPEIFIFFLKLKLIRSFENLVAFNGA